MRLFTNFTNIKTSLFFLLFLILTGCGGGGGGSSSNVAPPPILDSLTISGLTENLKTGSSRQLAVTATYSDSSTEDVSNSVIWASSSSSIANISNSGILTSISSGNVVINATLHEVVGSFEAEMIELVTINVSPATLKIAKNSKQQLIATGLYSDNSTVDLSTTVSWNSSNNSYANISSTGLLTSFSEGTSIISASINNTSGSSSITVSAAELEIISISAPPSIAAGISSQLIATGTFSDGSTQDITENVMWGTDNSAFANIGTNNGFLQAIQQGSVEVSATNGNLTTKSSIEIKAATLSKIVATPSVISLANGSSFSASVVAIFSDQSFVDITNQADWNSSNNDIASLKTDSTEIIAKKVGLTELTASFSDFEAVIQVEVSSAELAELVISPLNASIPKGLTQQFSASGRYTDGSVQDLSTQVTWISSSETISTIDNITTQEGLAYGLTEGQSTITAIIGEISQSTALTISTAQLSTIEVQPTNTTIAKGFSLPVKAMGYYSDGSQIDITNIVDWSSTTADILDLSESNNGDINTLMEGSTLINASNNDITGFGQINVTAATLQSITIDGPNSPIPDGHQQILKAYGLFSDSSTSDISQQVTWQSDDTSILTIDNTLNTGLLVAVDAGHTSVSASFSDVSSNIPVTVTNATLSQITISVEQATINAKTKTQATAIAAYSDNSIKDVTQQVNWSSTASGIASVENTILLKGLINGVSAGTASLSASLNGIYSTLLPIEITQNPNIPVSISLSIFPNVISNNLSDSAILQAQVIPADQNGSISDTTQVEVTIIEGDNTRTETISTNNGIASATITSDYEGLIHITASVIGEKLNSDTALYSTSNFGNVIAFKTNSDALYDNSMLLQDSYFAIFIRNLSNREFKIDQVDVATELSGILTHLPDSPITETAFLSNGALSGGEFSALGYILDINIPSNNLSIIYEFTDETSGQPFVKGVTYSF